MNMPGVCAPPREYTAPPPRERETKKLDETSSDEPVEGTDEAEDGTRSVQDLIAAAMQMFVKSEAKAEPAPAVAVDVQAIQLAATPTIEAAVQRVLDQISIGAKPAKPAEPAELDELSSTDERTTESQTHPMDGAILVEPELQTQAPMTSKGPVATTAVRDPAPLPENENPSHVHLVLDDGPQRVVVTVAVRGNEVSATIRGGDEQTAAALARNAGSLDHALRAGGLDLSSFTSERDLDHHAKREHAQREPKQDATKFEEDLT